METGLIVSGVITFLLALYHFTFPKTFDWKENMSFFDNAIVNILNQMIAYMAMVMAYFLVFRAKELITTSLGNALLVAFTMFWVVRIIVQFTNKLYKKPIAYVFIAVFVLMAFLNAWPLFL